MSFGKLISNETVRALELDVAGNVYITGEYYGPVDFDPGTETFMMTGSDQIYLSKLSGNGDFIWAKSWGANGYDQVADMIVENDHLYLAGSFESTVDFNPGASVNELISAGWKDVYLLKLDTAANFIWVKQFGGDDHQYALDLEIDNLHNIYILSNASPRTFPSFSFS